MGFPAARFGALALVCLAGFACRPAERAGLRVGDAFPDRRFARIDGAGEIALSGPRSGPVVVNVWATWCEPCRREMQSLEKLHRRLGPAGVRVVGISVDSDPHLAAEFMRAQRLTFENGMETAQALASPPLAVTKFPTTFVIDAAGIVRWREEAARDWADEAWVARMLALAKGDP